MLYTAGVSVSFGIVQECFRPINVHHVYNAYCASKATYHICQWVENSRDMLHPEVVFSPLAM
jgi:hypothetical protein